MSTKIIQHSWTIIKRPPQNSPLWELIENKVDLAFANPPYNYKVKYDGDQTKDNRSAENYCEWVENVIFQLCQMIRDGGTLWWLCPAEDGEWVWPALRRYGTLLYGQPIIWHERFSQYQQKQLTKDYRLLFPLKIGFKRPIFNGDDIREQSVRQQMGDKRANPDGRVPGHVWVVRRLQGTAQDRMDWHPAQLPPEPLERIVCGWTNKNDTILDAFAGLGSMGVVCLRNQRKFIGIEQSAHYCNKMWERLNREK